MLFECHITYNLSDTTRVAGEEKQKRISKLTAEQAKREMYFKLKGKFESG